MNEHNKGITLISLVITIVVLLILAAVAINLAVNSDGLFEKAGRAANEWSQSIAREETQINNLLKQPLPVGWDLNKIDDIIREDNRIAPIPQGYVASQATGESTISNGLVIYKGKEPVTDSNVAKALTTRDQYVWIPVDDINQMIMCKSNTASSVCNLELQADGSLKCMTHNSTDFAGRLYGVETTTKDTKEPRVYTTSMNFDKRGKVFNTDIMFREPDIATYYDNSTSYLKIAGIQTGETLLANLTQDFNEMANSVAKYKGFYVGRYEAGRYSCKKNQTVLTSANTPSTSSDIPYEPGNMWYGIYKNLRNVTGNIVKTHMIWRKSI